MNHNLLLLAALLPTCLSGQVVFSNDFETNTAGFSAGGSLSGLGRELLNTDSSGPARTATSSWLGKLGSGLLKNPSSTERVQLSLTGLTPGATYSVAFDLFIGASWDGSASFYGPDSWRLTVDGTTLVDTTFSNLAQGINAGAYSPQKYSDAGYADLSGADQSRFTGADQFWSANLGGNYLDDYAIYYFGRGETNPKLAFIAAGPTSVLEFSRYGATIDSSDEFWALDNVVVSALLITPPMPNAVPEPSTYGLVAALLLAGAALRRNSLRRSKICGAGNHDALPPQSPTRGLPVR
jgi:hypothetical protein